MLSNKLAIAFRKDGQKGVFAKENIAPDEVLITYDGPVIDHPTRFSIQIDENKHIEGTEDSNAFLNHSCSPNAYVDWNRLCLRALRAIEPGEEITCNYLTTDYDLHEKFHCRCGCVDCYGEITGYKYLTPEQQTKLDPFVAPFMKRRTKRGA